MDIDLIPKARRPVVEEDERRVGDPRSLAARIAPKTGNIDGLPGGGGGKGLRPEEIAGALAMGGASDEATLVIYAKWVGCSRSRTTLERKILSMVVDQAVKDGWYKEKNGKGFITRLIRVAVAELLDPHLCPSCGGKGEVWPKKASVPKICPICSGHRRKDWPESWRYRLMEQERGTWARWRPRYDKVMLILRGLEREGLESIGDGL